LKGIRIRAALLIIKSVVSGSSYLEVFFFCESILSLFINSQLPYLEKSMAAAVNYLSSLLVGGGGSEEDAPAEKRQRVEDGLEDLLRRQAKSASEQSELAARRQKEELLAASDAKWDARLTTLVQEFDKRTDQKVADSEKKMLTHMDEMKKELLSIFKKEQSEVASSVGAHSSFSLTVSGKPRYEASKIMMQGYVKDWQNLDAQAPTCVEALGHIDTVEQLLPDALSNLVDFKKSRDALRGIYAPKLFFILKAPSTSDAWKIKTALDTIVNESDFRLGTLNLRPKVVVESSPEKQPFLQAGGKFLGRLRDEGVAEALVKVDTWGPPSLRICVVPVDGSRPRKLATWTPSGGWGLQEAELMTLKNTLTAQYMMSRLQA